METLTTADSARAEAATTPRPASRSLFDPTIMRSAALDSLRKLDPRVQARNPVMFVVLVGSVITMTLALIFHFNEIFALSSFAFVWFLLSGLINFPMGRLLNYTAVDLAGVNRATPIIGASPLFAMALALAIGGESINVPIFLGTVSIIGGLVLVLSQR